ncbi:hypothetical protein QL285_033353 [Trifolium repens]|nr:hypothetical protein QL285_033353 [Trifolium repens]
MNSNTSNFFTMRVQVEHVEDGISKLTSLDFGEKENPNLIRVKKIVVERNIRDVKMFLLPRASKTNDVAFHKIMDKVHHAKQAGIESKNCTLILVEGDSAKNLVVSG